MIQLTVGDIAAITGATPNSSARLDDVVTGSVEFDSRRIEPGALFMALPGARVDGHNFVGQAVNNGAVISLVGRDVEAPALIAPAASVHAENQNATVFEHDTDGTGAAVLAAVDRLARYNTDQLVADQGLLVVGVTGSAGKTSTKDLIGSVLRSAGETIAPAGSFNNEIGLPYTVLQAGPTTRYLVAEMSARGCGHIRHLTEVAPPRIGVVLNVGSAHLGEFGSREMIAQAKGELVEALPAAANGGIAVLNADDPNVAAMASRTAAKVVRFSTNPGAAQASSDVDYYATSITLDEVARASFRFHYPGAEHPLQVNLGVFGAHQVSNALAAAAVGCEAGLDPRDVVAALNAHTATSANRMDVRTRRDGVTIINDSYNANPESMRAGINALAFTASSRDEAQSWAVLGQMGELGEDGAAEHQALGEYLVRRRIDHAVIVGNGVHQRALADAAAAAGVDTRSVEDCDGAINYLDLNVRPRDVVLVKASYSDGLWAVAEGLLIGEPDVPAQGEGV